MPSFFNHAKNRRWLVKLLLTAFAFILLAWGVWRYFAYRIASLQRMSD